MTTPPPPRYAVELTPAAARQLRKLVKSDPRSAALVRGAIELLAADPRPPASRPLVGSPLYRVRVGDYRVVYRIDDGVLIVLIVTVVTVGHRREVSR